MSDQLHAALYSFEDLAIVARSSDTGHLVWLREFLEPDFSVSDALAGDCEAAVVEDDRRYAEMRDAQGLEEAPLLDCFALDSSVVRLPVVDRRGGVTIVVDEQFESAYVIDADRRHVEIVTWTGNRRVRASLLRVVREFAMNHLHGRGLLLHAAAIAAGDAGLMIAGHKASGKTTLVTYLLSEGAASYLSNDRVLVTDDGGGPVIRNIPTVISVRPGTLEACPAFRARFERSGYASYLCTLDELARGPRQAIAPNQFGNYFLSPPQYRRLVEAPQRHRATARVLVFPVVTSDVETFALRDVPVEDTVGRLPGAYLGAGSWRKGTDAFAVPSGRPTPDEADLDGRARRLASSVLTVECRLGPQAYRDGRLAREIHALLG